MTENELALVRTALRFGPGIGKVVVVVELYSSHKDTLAYRQAGRSLRK